MASLTATFLPLGPGLARPTRILVGSTTANAPQRPRIDPQLLFSIIQEGTDVINIYAAPGLVSYTRPDGVASVLVDDGIVLLGDAPSEDLFITTIHVDGAVSLDQVDLWNRLAVRKTVQRALRDVLAALS